MMNVCFILAQVGPKGPTTSTLVKQKIVATHLVSFQVCCPGHRYVLGAHGPPYYVSSMVPPDSCFHRLSRLYGALCDEPFYYA